MKIDISSFNIFKNKKEFKICVALIKIKLLKMKINAIKIGNKDLQDFCCKIENEINFLKMD